MLWTSFVACNKLDCWFVGSGELTGALRLSDCHRCHIDHTLRQKDPGWRDILLPADRGCLEFWPLKRVFVFVVMHYSYMPKANILLDLRIFADICSSISTMPENSIFGGIALNQTVLYYVYLREEDCKS